MIKLGINRREFRRLNELLATHHHIRVSVQLLNLEHEYLGDISRRLLGGQLTIDADATEATRAVTMELLDPEHRLKLDADAPEDGSLYFNRMMRIVYSVLSPDRTEIFDIPIFTGPLTKVERQGAVISVEALGKEKLSRAAVWNAHTFKAGLKKTWVIERIMVTMGGEMRRQIPERKPKIPKKLDMNREKTPWDTAKAIAGSMGLQLYYDGRGVLRLRKPPSKTLYVFREKGVLLSHPQISYDAESAVNAVEVIGGKPKGAKKKIRYRMVAPKAHVLSPWRMGRWGIPRYLPETIDNDSIRSTKEAREVAKRRLRNALIESVEVAFDSLPVPYLEELDMCRVSSDGYAGNFRLRKMTIPFTADGVSSVGYLKRVVPNRRQVRIRNTRKRKRRNR
jgi:hypothetical protein